MNKHKSLPALFLLAGLGWCAAAFAARPYPQENSDLPVDAAVQWGRMDNGVRYVIMPWSEPPERVSLRLLVEAGSLQENERQKGLAHLIEHMAFNGTRHYSAGEMVEYFQRLGMAFGPDTNAHTWWRETVYKLELPRNEESLLRDGLQLLRDYADGMLMEEEEIEKEKGVVLSEYRDRNSPQFQAYVDGLKFALPDSLISDRVVIGDQDVIRMATREDLMEYYQSWYTPERMVLIAVGEVDPDRMEALFKEYFAGMPPNENPLPDPDLGGILPAETKVRMYSNAELPIAEVEIYNRTKIGPAADTFEMRLDELRQDLANAMLSRRFERLSKEEGAPFTQGSGYGYRWLDFVQYAGVSLRFEPADWQSALEVAVTELNRALAHGFSGEELAEAKAKYVNFYEEAAARAPTRKSRDLSSGLVRSVRDGIVFMDPAVERDLMVPAIEALTLAEIEGRFRKAWENDERLVNLSGNFESILKDRFEEAAAIEVEAAGVEERKPWAYTGFGNPGNVVNDNYVKDLGIRQLVFGNGLRLNLKQTDYEANKIHVKASFGSGKLELPADKPGLSLMAGRIFISGGLGEHSEDEIKALTAGKTVGVEFSVDDNQFTLGGITNQEDLLLQLQLMAAYMRDPGYRPEGRRLLMRQLDGLYSQLAHDPNGVMQNEVARFLASGDPRFGFPAREELEARTTEEVGEWLREPLQNGYLELSIVGDFKDMDPVVAAVARTFGAFPDRTPERPELAEARRVAFPRDSGETVFAYESEIPRAMATVNWPTTDQSDIFRTRRLSVLASVYSDRMRVQIREATGEAYSPYAFNNSSDTYDGYGYFRALVGVDPDKTGEIQKILLRIGAELAESGVDEDERVRAIEPIKSQIEEYRRTNQYWLNSVLLRSQDEPERLDWARTFADFWDTVTVGQLNELARQYLSPSDGLPVQIVPRS